ncbi:MAG: hypothetical protein A2Z37_10005 [Chloroflexi bacterium RBG_19FT_COMBO_62_14]|nr:MAG: hypothetical protein A2Z37_10005 [Chloroflexi bacterium RBG_19FT_COMBO_62_14]
MVKVAILGFGLILLSACSVVLPQATPTQPPPTETATLRPTDTATATLTPTDTPTSTESPTPTLSPTASDTPTPEATPTPTDTPTPEPLTITADGSVNCRYGPSQAYLYAWGLSEGDSALVKGKDANGTWLWVQPHDTTWNCWVSTSAVTLNGDLASVKVVYPQLLTNPAVGPPSGVNAARNGDNVTVTWSAAAPAVDLGYLIEARICLDTYLWDVYYSTTNTSYTIKDPPTCSGESYGQLRVFNKLGYSTAVKIPWP